MANDQLIPLNIVIADRQYRIKAYPKDEETIRNTVKFVNDKILEFKTQFAGKDLQDYLSMVVIWYATQAANGNNPIVDEKPITDALKKLEVQLDAALK